MKFSAEGFNFLSEIGSKKIAVRIELGYICKTHRRIPNVYCSNKYIDI